MRKWTYLVAALLVGGATTTFTGCIDNDEPAGIEQLRGAKAEFIKAKAAFETVLTEIQRVKIEREQVSLEADKVALDLQKLNLEKEQASTAWLKDSLQARQDTLAASLKEQLLAIQKKADTNADLQESLAALEVAMVTAKDEAFGEAIKDVKEALAGITEGELHTYGALDYLKDSNARLLKAKSDLLDFLSDNKYLEDKLNAGIDEAKAALATQEKVLEDMKTFAATPTSEWNTKLAEISKQIAAVNADVVAKSEAIAKQTAEIQPVLADIEREKAKLDTKDKSFTIPVVDAALQNDLAGFVQESNVLTSDEFNKVFKQDGATGEYTMIADLSLSGLSLNNYYEATSVVSYIRSAYSSSSSQDVGYIQLFNNAYERVFSYRNSPSIQPTDAEIAKAKGELARMAIDKADKYAIFQKDSTAWMDSYLAYMTALTNYKNYQQTTTYEAIAAKVDAYKALAPADQTKDKANALIADLKAYGQLRDAVDGATGRVNVDNKEVRLYSVAVIDDSGTPTGNQVTLSSFNSHIQRNDNSQILGNQQLATSFYNSTLSDFDGAIQRLILASNTLFGTYKELKYIIEPKKVGDKYYLPEDVEAGNNTCSYYLYTTAMKDVAIFTNIEKWIALDNSLTADLKKFDDAKKPIADNIATLQAGIADKQDAIWKAELEVKLLDYTQNMSNGNPYSVSNPSACQIQALNSLMTTIKNAITNGGQVTYVTYDPVNHKFERVEGTIEKLISDQESKIATAKDAVATAEGKLEAYKTLGKDDKSRFESDLQTAITNAEQEVAFMQAEVDRLNATLKKLLDAYAAE